MILERATRPSGFRLLALGILAGVLLTALAVGAYHQSGDARVCGSCHSMNFVRDQWRLSNHRQYTCTECHLPDTHLPG